MQSHEAALKGQRQGQEDEPKLVRRPHGFPSTGKRGFEPLCPLQDKAPRVVCHPDLETALKRL
jgi:hypothetical protein